MSATTKPATLLSPMGSMGEEIEQRFWEHRCEDGGLTGTQAGYACSWCQMTEGDAQRLSVRGVHGSESWDASAGEAA